MRFDKMRQKAATGLVALFATLTPVLAGLGQPTPWQMNLQKSASSSMDDLVWFHDFLLIIITLITIFVAGLLAYACWRFSEKRNPIPSKTTHNTLVEVLWTVIPVLILVAIAIPSFQILYTQQDVSKPDITIKAIGKQWFWSYEYSDHGNFGFDQVMLDEKDRAKAIAGDAAKGIAPRKAEELPRLLAVDNEIVLPIGKKIKVNVTAADVLHAWTIPSFGVKTDAVPGRTNALWFRADKEGIFYGQCSEICGKDHSHMPIAIRIVSEAKYKEWLEMAKKKYASSDDRQLAGK